MQPTLAVTDKIALADDPPPVTVSGLAPHHELRLSYRLVDHFRRPWTATVAAQADATGGLDLRMGLPDPRWEDGRDPFAGLWSVRCDVDPGARFSDSLAGEVEPLHVELSVELDEESPLRCEFLREFVGPDVRRTKIREDGVIAELFAPEAPQSSGGTIVLGGAWGWFSWSREVAALLASRGRAAMAVAYFDWGAREGLPRTLSEIPLERLERAVDILAARPEVDAADLAVVGISKGAEAGLLLAARRPDIARVIALSTSSHAWESVRVDRRAEASSWSLAGAPVPYLRFNAGEDFYRTLDKRLLLACHKAALDTEADPAAAIGVERIQADMLLISLTGDVVWPSRRMGDDVAARMADAGAGPVRHMVLNAAGHALFAPGLPANAVDGDPAAAARADFRAWQEILQHLGVPYRVGTRSVSTAPSRGDRL